jgi:hypothetical protein
VDTVNWNHFETILDLPVLSIAMLWLAVLVYIEEVLGSTLVQDFTIMTVVF